MKISPPGVFTAFAFSIISGSFIASLNLSDLTNEFYLLDRLSRLEVLIEKPANWLFLIVTSFCTSLILLVGRRARLAIPIAILPAISFCFAAMRLPAPLATDSFFLKDELIVKMNVTVKRIQGKNIVVAPYKLLFPEQSKLSGNALLKPSATINFKISPEDSLLITGKVKAIRRSKSDYSFDKRSYLARANIFSVIKASQIVKIKPNKSRARWLNLDSIRKKVIAKHIAILGEDQGKLLASIVLGDRAVNLPGHLKESFRVLGLSHLLAASGFNLSILVGSVYFLSKRFSLSKPSKALLSLAAITGFSSLAGFSPSVSRAALVLALIVLASLIYRRVNPIALLSFTLLVFCLYRPVNLLDVGLQLSYAATFSIITGIDNASTLVKMLNPNRFTKWILELTSVILLAQAAVLPIQIYYFWELGLFFLVANILVDPIVAPITIFGFASTILAILIQFLPLPEELLITLVFILDKIVSLPLMYMISISKALSQITSNTILVGAPPIWSITFYYACLLIAISHRPNKRTSFYYWLIYLVSLLFLFQKVELNSNWILFKDNTLAITVDRTTYANRLGSYSTDRLYKFYGINGKQIKPLDRLQIDSNLAKLAIFSTGQLQLIACLKGSKVEPLYIVPLSSIKNVLSSKKTTIIWTKSNRKNQNKKITKVDSTTYLLDSNACAIKVYLEQSVNKMRFVVIPTN